MILFSDMSGKSLIVFIIVRCKKTIIKEGTILIGYTNVV